MSDQERLREAFASDERSAPDAAAVYARIEELSRSHKRRRRGAQVASGAVIGAGLIAAAVNLPGLLPGPGVGESTSPAFAAAPAPSPTSEADLARYLDAYFDAGYGFADALKLSQIWHATGDITSVKAEAGRRLLAGETLPVQPEPGQEQPAEEADRVDAFFEAGYDYDDAVELAKLWKTDTPYDAKVLGGKKLLAGETLPIRP